MLLKASIMLSAGVFSQARAKVLTYFKVYSDHSLQMVLKFSIDSLKHLKSIAISSLSWTLNLLKIASTLSLCLISCSKASFPPFPKTDCWYK